MTALEELNRTLEAARRYKAGLSNMELVAAELGAAKQKHPHFCDALIDTREIKWADSEKAIKKRVDSGHDTADNILMEVVAEAFAAAEAGDLACARHRLAQVAAVAIRGMEYIEEQTRKGAAK